MEGAVTLQPVLAAMGKGAARGLFRPTGKRSAIRERGRHVRHRRAGYSSAVLHMSSLSHLCSVVAW
jgi:hypothetical protein